MATNDVKSAQDSAQQAVADLSSRLMKMLQELQQGSPMDVLKNLIGMLRNNINSPLNQETQNLTPNDPANQQTQTATLNNPSANQQNQANIQRQQTNQQTQTATAAAQPTAQQSQLNQQTPKPTPEHKNTDKAKPEHKERKAKTEQKKDKSRGSDAAWDSQMKLLNATLALGDKVDKLKVQHDAKHKERQQTQSQQKTQHTTPSPGR
ncbi:MAG: hypothetical protein M3R00_07280 [Pseudomonadota bacterium]|nr:hypothetical protein [Pseudomonadota bacterium]